MEFRKKVTLERTLTRLEGVLRAFNRRDITITELANAVGRIVREERAEMRKGAA